MDLGTISSRLDFGAIWIWIHEIVLLCEDTSVKSNEIKM